MKYLIKYTIFLLLTGSCVAACTTTKVVTVERVRTDTLRKYHTLHDSIHVHDSVRIDGRGDTVLIERWHTKYRERQVHDTLYQSRVDSVPVPYPVEKFVEKQLAWWQKALMYVGALSLLLFCLWLWKTK